MAILMKSPGDGIPPLGAGILPLKMACFKNSFYMGIAPPKPMKADGGNDMALTGAMASRA